MVRIRLQRVGAKNQPSYRVVVIDSRAPRDSAYIERIGHYNPLTNPETVIIEQAKADKWLKLGAQPSEAVGRLLSKQGLWPAPTKSPKAKDSSVPEAATKDSPVAEAAK
jgi:small subunit ribosomal protein S16